MQTIYYERHAMKYRTLGRTGFKVSEVSLGGAGLAGRDPERAQESATSIVRRAAELGLNYIDTAPYYGKSEELLGPALAAVDHKFYVATKLGLVPKDFDYTSDSVLASIEHSLKRLGLDRLDVAQIHEVNHAGWERITDPGGALEGLRKAQDRGLCDKIGVTGRAIPLLTQLAETDEFDTLLFYHDYHPCEQKAAEELIPAAAAHHMGIVAATVLAGGLYVPGQPQHIDDLLRPHPKALLYLRRPDLPVLHDIENGDVVVHQLVEILVPGHHPHVPLRRGPALG